MSKAPTSSTSPYLAGRTSAAVAAVIDAAVERWCDSGLVQRTDWDGAPLIQTPLPHGKDVRFDEASVVRVLRFFRVLKQTIGRWSGRDFVLLDWQVRYFVAPVFGLKNGAGFRIIRTVWFEIPRKNGKSTLCSGLGLYMLMADREAAAEVYSAAADKKQATRVFKPAHDMAAGSDAISMRLGRGLTKYLLEYPKTHSMFRALSSDGALQHGLNVHCALIDEVHVHKNPDLIEALETGTGSREQPLVIFITTADDGDVSGAYGQHRELVESVAAGTVPMQDVYGVVFGADETVDGFDAFSDETIHNANPGAGITVTWEYLHAAAAKAQAQPSALNSYLRLHLNIRTKQTTRWLTLPAWDTAAGTVCAEDWEGVDTWGGLDLSSTTDMTAFVLIGKVPLERAPDRYGYIVHPMFWLPELRAEELEARFHIPFRLWSETEAPCGGPLLHLTEGNVVDYRQMRADIYAEVARLKPHMMEVGFDPWNAAETIGEMVDDGYSMVEVRQGYGSLSGACKDLERLVYGSTPEAPLFRHGGHAVLRWHVDCVEVRSDPSGNIKPEKPDRFKTSKRIDGVAGAVTSLNRAMNHEQEPEYGYASF